MPQRCLGRVRLDAGLIRKHLLRWHATCRKHKSRTWWKEHWARVLQLRFYFSSNTGELFLQFYLSSNNICLHWAGVLQLQFYVGWRPNTSERKRKVKPLRVSQRLSLNNNSSNNNNKYSSSDKHNNNNNNTNDNINNNSSSSSNNNGVLY